MKKILQSIVFLCLFVFSAQAQSSRIFDVRAYGAVGNCTASGSLGSCTNDVASIRKAFAAANANGGGVIYFPNTATNAYYQEVGDVSTDVNYTTITAPHYAVWNITSNNVRVELAPGVTIRTAASYLCQTNTGGGTLPCSQYLFYYGNGVTTIENGVNAGSWGTFKFEVISPGAYLTGDNSANGFHFWGGATKYQVNEKFFIDGFPNGGTVGGYTSGSDTLASATFRDVHTIQYGSGGDDLCWYVQGNVLFDHCSFVTSRKSSHGVYTGALRPWLRVQNSYFSGQDESAGLNNKYGVQLYQTSGTASINSIWFVNNTFHNVRNGMWLEHVQGATGGSLDNIHIIGNSFTRDSSTPVGTAIQAQWLNDSVISGNFGKYQTGLISILSSGPGKNVTITDNHCFDCTGLLNVNVAQSNVSGNSYRRSGVASTGATRFNVVGSYNTVNNNQITDGGSSAGSPVGLILNGTGIIADGNILRATASQSYSIALQAANCNQCRITNNIIEHTGSAYSDLSGQEMLVQGNASNKLITIAGGGANYTDVIGNRLYSSAQLRLTGLCRPIGNNIGSWETITGAYGGSGNITNSTDLDHDSAAFAASFTPHAGVYKSTTKTVTANLTINAPTNPIKGQTLTFNLIQGGASGGYTFTWNAIFKVETACATPTTTTLGTRTVVSYLYDGSSWIQTSCKTGL